MFILPNILKHFFSNSKQIDVSQVSDLLKKLVPEKGKTKKEVAGKLEISPQLLGQYMKNRQKPKPEFYKSWKKVFGEDLLNYSDPENETNVSRETKSSLSNPSDLENAMPVGKPITVREFVDNLKATNDFYQEMLRNGILSIATNLNDLSRKFLGGEPNSGGDNFSDPDNSPPV